MQKISTSKRWHMHKRVSSAPLQSKRSPIKQLLCYGDNEGYFFGSLIRYFFDLDPFTSTQPMPVHFSLMNALEDVVPNAWDVLKSGNIWGTSHILSGSQAGSEEAQETLRVVFARKRLGRCRMTCSSCESVQQQASSNICSQEGLLWCSEQMFSISYIRSR